MSKDPLDKVGEAIKKTVDDTTDMVHEGQHRSAADAEKARRSLLGDEMKPGEKAGSVVNEAKYRTQAEIDAVKRHLRDKT